MASIDDIKHVVIVLMENRSFDHMLGYLSLPPFSRPDVDGQSLNADWLNKAQNPDGGQNFQPFHNSNAFYLPPGFDPPHQRENVAAHLGSFNDGVYAMNGFVGAIPQNVSNNPDHRKLVMSYFGAEEVPMNHFLASNFTICDRWFCAVPSGTQPNRLMAMGGTSIIESNATPLPSQELVYDWLDKRNIPWCVYHQGLPFFTMMLQWVGRILEGKNFRPFSSLESDLESTPPAELPKVIFVEPTYGDAPHFGRSTDDHAPSGVSDGQEFLMQVYNAVSSSRAFWNASLTFIGYDEHGGFFDHVSPPLVQTDPPVIDKYPKFTSLGPRTPAFVVSPFVKPGACSHDFFDHTSVLKFLGEKFGGGSYAAPVDSRPAESLSKALNFDAPIIDRPVAPAMNAYLEAKPKANPLELTAPAPQTELQQAFRAGVEELKRQGDPSHPVFGNLIQQVPG